MAVALLSLGKKLSWAAGDITGLVSLEINYGKRKAIPVGDLGTAIAATEPQLFGLRDPDIISGRIKFDPADTVHAAMKVAFLAATSAAVVYTRTDAAPATTETWSAAVITDFQEPSGDKDSPALASFQITCNVVGVAA
jgi:hypothetical protein